MSDTVPIKIRVPSDGPVLHTSLGTFWNMVIDDTEFVERLMYSFGTLSEQAEQNYEELLAQMSRDTVPIYHRERWFPLVLKKSARGTGKATKLTIGMDPPVVIGAQPVSTAYEYRAVYTIGGNAIPGGYISYPMNSNVKKSMSYICNRISTPDTILVAGVDYIVENDTVLFKKTMDPFDSGKFATITSMENGVEQVYAVLWATDILIDMDYIYNNFGYAVALQMESSEYYLNVVNSIWDGLTEGARQINFETLIAAALNIQVIKADGEVVSEIMEDPYGNEKLLVTDRNVYRYSPQSIFKDSIVKGVILRKGLIPIDTVRIYSSVSSEHRLDSDFSRDQFKIDVPSLYVSKNLLRCAIKYGLIFNWDDTPVYFVGKDSNGHAKLWFRLGGSEEDLDSFWNNVWNSFEKSNTDPAYIFSEYFNTDAINKLDASYRPPRSSDYREFDLISRATYPIWFTAPSTNACGSGVIINNWRFTVEAASTYIWKAYNMQTGRFYDSSPLTLTEFTTATGSALYFFELLKGMSSSSDVAFYTETTNSPEALHLIDPLTPSVQISQYTQTLNSITTGAKLEVGRIDKEFSNNDMLVGYIKPLEFLMDNFLSTNVTFIVIDSAKLNRNIDLTVLSRLRDFIPAHTCVMVIIKQEVAGETYEFEVTASDTIKLKYIEDETGNMVDVYGNAVEPFHIAVLGDLCYYNSINTGTLNYRDNRPIVKIVSDCIRR